MYPNFTIGAHVLISNSLILHPRSVFGVRSEKESFAMAYGCKKKDATLQ